MVYTWYLVVLGTAAGGGGSRWCGDYRVTKNVSNKQFNVLIQAMFSSFFPCCWVGSSVTRKYLVSGIKIVRQRAGDLNKMLQQPFVRCLDSSNTSTIYLLPWVGCSRIKKSIESPRNAKWKILLGIEQKTVRMSGVFGAN